MKELLLINLDGLVYGIWENEVFSIDELTTIHRLPVSPAFIAGVSIIHDRAVTLADLSVCVGHAPMKRSGAGHVLIMSDTEQFAGFVIESDISKAAILPDSVYPLPDCIKTPMIDSCVIVDSLPIPVINISALYLRVQKTAPEPLAAQLTLSGSHGDITGIETIRLFEIHGERFAASAAGIEEQIMKSGHISRLKQAPRFVRGIVFLQGRILPVIDLLQRLNMQETENRGLLLVVELGGSQFGLLIHADEGTLKKEDVAIKDLPPIAQSRWLRSSVTYAGDIVPLLDLGALMFSEQEREQEKPMAQRYAPDSGFLDLFGREEIDVVEFSLLGQRHALPKSEVNDTIGFKPYREIPNVPNIVIGVAEYKEELLPVLDLAMVFGRRSLATSDWRMLHVINGDFQALVITEIVYGEQRLFLDIQRAVPIKLPHRVVYGCYPDADAVRLVLNVEALAVHFEKALVQELLPALSAEMKQARAELVPSLLEESAVPSGVAAESEAPKEQYIPQEPAAVLQPVKAEEVIPVLEQPAVPEVIEMAQLSADIENARKEAEERARREAEEQLKKEAEEKALRKAEERQKAEAAARVAEEERARREAEENARQEAIERAHQEAAEQARSEAEAKALQEAEEQQKAEAATRAAEEERVRREAEERARQEAIERERREAEEQAAAEARKKDEAEEKARKEAAAVVQEAEDIARREREKAIRETTVPSTSFKSEEAGVAHVKTLAKPTVQWKSFVSLAIIGIVIVAVLYLLFRKPLVEVKEAKAPIETVQQKTKEPLVLTVPVGMSLETDAYSVKKGDTLWDISKRFTGNALNYPSIAGINRIEDPDLIYPEQKIEIRKKEK